MREVGWGSGQHVIRAKTSVLPMIWKTCSKCNFISIDKPVVLLRGGRRIHNFIEEAQLDSQMWVSGSFA